ncbi:peptidoglycan-associated lipoprotein Pal [bacterium]|nr:peptidoglycan-associated lipoprotein Pal [bacterium]
MKMIAKLTLAVLLVTFLAMGVFTGCASQKQMQEEQQRRDQARQDSVARVEAAQKAEREKVVADSLAKIEEANRLKMEEERLARERVEKELASMHTVYFAFDQSKLTSDARTKLQENAVILQRYPDRSIVIEGHTDERGSTEYNLALGERRAAAVQKYYQDYGISGERIRIISYGEERPATPGNNEDAWSKNRRALTKVQ